MFRADMFRGHCSSKHKDECKKKQDGWVSDQIYQKNDVKNSLYSLLTQHYILKRLVIHARRFFNASPTEVLHLSAMVGLCCNSQGSDHGLNQV